VWGSENPQEVTKREPESPEVNVQGAVKKDINGPFFFEELTMTGKKFLWWKTLLCVSYLQKQFFS
jgi:hypothetical protein